MLSEELEQTLNVAFKEAREKRHEFMTVEHLLLALVENPASNNALRACGANLDQLKRELEEFLEETTPILPDGDDREIEPTLGFQRVLQRAVASRPRPERLVAQRAGLPEHADCLADLDRRSRPLDEVRRAQGSERQVNDRVGDQDHHEDEAGNHRPQVDPPRHSEKIPIEVRQYEHHGYDAE